MRYLERLKIRKTYYIIYKHRRRLCQKIKKNDPLIDVGETVGADVEFESKQEESSNENTEEGIKSIDTTAQSNEQPVVQDSKQETEIKDQGTDTDSKKELEITVKA
jgi:hypothetical protein